MKRMVFVGFLVALASLLVAAVACGDDDDDGGDDGGATPANGGEELTLEEYITEVDDVQDSLSSTISAVGTEFQSSFEDPDRARLALSTALDAGQSTQSVLGGLNPPADAQAQHDALVAAAGDLVTAVSNIDDSLQGVEPGAEFDQIVADAQAEGSELQTALQEIDAACDDIQTLADDNSIEAEIDCSV